MNALTVLATVLLVFAPLNEEYMIVLMLLSALSAVSMTSLRVIVTGRLP